MNTPHPDDFLNPKKCIAFRDVTDSRWSANDARLAALLRLAADRDATIASLSLYSPGSKSPSVIWLDQHEAGVLLHGLATGMKLAREFDHRPPSK